MEDFSNKNFDVVGSALAGQAISDPNILAKLNTSVQETPRGRILREASALTAGQRNKDYGPPKRNLDQIAGMLNEYLKGRDLNTKPLTAGDIAIVNILIKVSRLVSTPNHEDSWKDMAAYAAIGYEVTN